MFRRAVFFFAIVAVAIAVAGIVTIMIVARIFVATRRGRFSVKETRSFPPRPRSRGNRRSSVQHHGVL